MNDGLSQAALATALGLAKSRVTALKKLGMPVSSVEEAQAWRSAHQSIARRKRPADAAGASAAAEPESAAPGRQAFDLARTRREIAEANLSELREGELRGELIRLPVVEAVWAQALAATREHLLQVRARLAPLIAHESDPFKVEQLLDAAHSEALQHMAAAEARPAMPKAKP